MKHYESRIRNQNCQPLFKIQFGNSKQKFCMAAHSFQPVTIPIDSCTYFIWLGPVVSFLWLFSLSLYLISTILDILPWNYNLLQEPMAHLQNDEVSLSECSLMDVFSLKCNNLSAHYSVQGTSQSLKGREKNESIQKSPSYS